MLTGGVNRKSSSKAFDCFSVVLVSVYLLAVGTWLIATRQIPVPGFRRIIRTLMRRTNVAVRRDNVAVLGEVAWDEGHCYIAALHPSRPCVRAVRLLEDGREIAKEATTRADVRKRGGGRYSLTSTHLYFSSSDNSDPRTNGRQYILRDAH